MPETSTSHPSSQARLCGQPARASTLGALKTRDNVTNWRHLGQVYAVLILTIGTAISLEHLIWVESANPLLLIPVALVAIITVGAAQHQLGGAVHEGTHFMLFADRRLNELASDWLAAFPIYTSTYQFRVHHLAHHQFVNDPVRDPDIAQLVESHHWLDFPVAHIDLLRALLKQLWLPNLVRYTLARARYSALGFDDNPYRDESRKAYPWPSRVGILYAIGAPTIAATLVALDRPVAALAVTIGLLALVAAYIACLPEAEFPQTRLEPVISHRVTALSRMAYMGANYSLLTLAEMATGAPVWGYFGLFWVVPLFTTFALFMILRQWVQHGNADRGRYTNTRTFLVGPAIRYAVFPWGMNYHLPHHLYASVPHYNLAALHEALLGDEDYRRKGVIVEGYFGSASPSGRPTAMAVIGPGFAPRGGEPAYIDNAAIAEASIHGHATIASRAAQSLDDAGDETAKKAD